MSTKIQFRFHTKPGNDSTGISIGLMLLILSFFLFTRTQARGTLSQLSRTTVRYPESRQFYLTRGAYNSNDAPTACATGYHFASIWEIADPSSLKYNKSFGWVSNDSGDGPPTMAKFFNASLTMIGWVRTGYTQSSLDIPGQANCLGWLSNSEFSWGSVANLPSDWLGKEQDIGVWNVGVRTCDEPHYVWCIQDNSGWWNYLPLMLR